MSSTYKHQTQVASILPKELNGKLKPGAAGFAQDADFGKTITRFTRTAAACVVAAALLAIGVAFVLVTQYGESKEEISMGRRWPRVAVVKTRMQRFLRQSLRSTDPKEYAY